jgi:hypothetical protein
MATPIRRAQVQRWDQLPLESSARVYRMPLSPCGYLRSDHGQSGSCGQLTRTGYSPNEGQRKPASKLSNFRFERYSRPGVLRVGQA